MLSNFNDSTMAKMKEVLEQKAATQKAYTDSVRETLGMWSRATDTNFQLANRNFEERSQDFLRFLMYMKERFQNQTMLQHSSETQLVEGFRPLIRVWFLVYGEASSIDPRNRPLRVEAHGELDHCDTLSSLFDVAHNLLSQCRSAVSVENCLAFLGEDPQALFHLALNRPPLRRSLLDLESAQKEDPKPLCCSWIGCCCRWLPDSPRAGCYWHCCRSEVGNLSETSCCCGCCWMLILDWSHLRVILAVIAGFIVSGVKVALPMLNPEYTWKEGTFAACLDAAPIALYFFCLLVLLTKVEYTNMIAAVRLETQQVKDLNDQVNNLRTEVQNFARQSVQLTELWLHCTLPRLDLMKEIHCHIRDASIENLVPQLRCTNAQLAQLETWCGGLLEQPDSETCRRRLSSNIDVILRNPSADFGEGNGTASFSGRIRLDSLLQNLEEFLAREDRVTDLHSDSICSSFPLLGMRRTPIMESFCSRECIQNSDTSSVDSGPTVPASAPIAAQQVQQAANQFMETVNQQAQQAGELMMPAVAQLQTDYLRPAAAQLQRLHGLCNNFFANPQAPPPPSTLAEPFATDTLAMDDTSQVQGHRASGENKSETIRF